MSTEEIQAVDPRTVTLWHRHYAGHDVIATRTFGFWLYMLSDAMIFAGLFATYFVLSHTVNAAGGPTAHDIVHPLPVFGQTLLVFSSVLAYGGAMVALKRGSRTGVLAGITAAFVFGLGFVAMDVNALALLISQGATAERSGFLSAFFTLVVAHGLHMAFGLLWMLVMVVQIVREGFTTNVVYRLLNLKIFWYFQAVVWVCVFSFVYMRGMMG